jgi:cytochrome P450 family 150 subfamily A5
MTESEHDAFEGVDFFSDTGLIDDPYPYFAFLRDQKGPVWMEPQYGVAIVTGHLEAMAVLRDHDTFSSCNAPTGPFPGLPVAPEGDDATSIIDEHRDQLPMHEFMVTMDPPRHNELRGLMRGLFTPRRLKENEDFMWRLADEQLEEFLARGHCEFVAEYAAPYTSVVIADLLGVPDEDRSRFRQLFDKMTMAEVSEEQQILVDNPLAYIEGAFTHYVEDRRAAPRTDVLTHLAQATFSDGGVPEVTALAREASFIFAAGQETTVRLLAFAMRHLAEHQDVQQRLRDDRELIPEFVEEMLRLESPIKAYFRMARRTTMLGGVRVPAGTSVMLLPGAANRDPRQFAKPDAFALDRANGREQLAFSRGVHSCLGQPLARSEGRITVERVLDRMREFHVMEEYHGTPDERTWEYLPTWIFRGLSSIHVTFRASAETGA